MLRKTAMLLFAALLMLNTKFVMAQSPIINSSFDCLTGYLGNTEDPIIHGQSFCPYTDGFAVFEARALVSYYDSVGTQYRNSCELTEPLAANRSAYNDLSSLITNGYEPNQQELEASNIVIMPNPNQGNFTVISNSLAVVNVKVVDLSGRLVYQTNVKEPSKRIELSNTGLNTGVYIVQTTNELGAVQQNKLFITEQ